MTCIVAAVEKDGTIYMGGDTAGVTYSYGMISQVEPKVFQRGEYVMGYTSSFRMGQILEHKFNPPSIPKHLETSLTCFMVNNFVDALRACFKEAGWSQIKDNREQGGTFLVGCRGNVFIIEEEFNVLRMTGDISAVGCGGDFALGALHATEGQNAYDRVLIALEAAQRLSAGVRAPFHIITSKGERFNIEKGR